LFPSHCCLVWFHRSRPASIKTSIIKRVGLTDILANEKRGLMVKKVFPLKRKSLNKMAQKLSLYITWMSTSKPIHCVNGIGAEEYTGADH
jgi:hypothetical protein